MAIEIKELRIKVTITEPSPMNADSGRNLSPEKLQEFRLEIVKECTRTVLEKIKERAER